MRPCPTVRRPVGLTVGPGGAACRLRAMCGRAYETYTAEELAFAYLNRRPLTFAVGPNYNLAPTQVSPVVLMRDGVRDVELSRWGLIPFPTI